MAPDAPQAGGWRADLRRLASQFRFDSYLLIRDDSVPSPAASPILGGGQLGYSVGYTPAPLSKRPIELFARGSVPYASNGRVVSRYSQGAVGVRWRFLPRVAVDVERQVGFGFAARDDWAARLAGGLDGDARAIGRAWRWDSYAEAGVVGIGESSWYAGMQGRVGTPIAGRDSVLLLGAGVWASAQGGLGADVSRVDIGPSLRLLPRKYPVQAQLDYRLQAAGNASPGSGPVLTITAGF